ncbi:hypothetical protein BH18VER1_BH18VER1_22670 [soil metagenome]
MIDREANIGIMTTRSRLTRRCSSLVKTATAVIGLTLCASAWADSGNKNVVAGTKSPAVKEPAAPQKRPQVYVRSIASAIPLPLEQFGVFPSTTRPIAVMGRQESVVRRP